MHTTIKTLNEFQLMQTFGINEFNALDMRSKANG